MIIKEVRDKQGFIVKYIAVHFCPECGERIEEVIEFIHDCLKGGRK